MSPNHALAQLVPEQFENKRDTGSIPKTGKRN